MKQNKTPKKSTTTKTKEPDKPKHGGAREGAGRHPYPYEVKVYSFRVPTPIIDEVRIKVYEMVAEFKNEFKNED